MSNKKWTVMVYLAGDNNLTEEMVWALQEMKKAAADPTIHKRVNVIAQYDPRGKNPRTYDIVVDSTSPPLSAKNIDGDLDTLPISVLSAPQQYDAALQHIVEECYQAATKENPSLEPMLPPAQHLVQEIKKVDQITDHLMTLLPNNCHNNSKLKEKMACLFKEISDHLAWNYNAAAVLKTFVNEQIEKAIRAENYLVVLSGHGSGAIGDFLTDSDPQTALSIPKLRQLLGLIRIQFKKRRHVEHSNRHAAGKPLIDVLGMDSCLMSMAELCYKGCREYADYLVGSEGFVQNTGWPYHRILESLRSSPEPEGFVKTIVQRYTCFYQDYEVAGVSTDISACNLKYLRQSNFIRNIRLLSDQLTNSVKNLAVIRELEQLDKQPTQLHKNLLSSQNKLKRHLNTRIASLRRKSGRKKLPAVHAKALSKLINAGQDLKKMSRNELNGWLNRNINTLRLLFGATIDKDPKEPGRYCPILVEYLTAQGLAGENLVRKLRALIHHKRNLEPRVANALIELRLEIELCVLNDAVGFKSALNALDKLAAMGVAESLDLQEGLRHLADLKRKTELAETVNLRQPQAKRQEWTTVLNAIHLAHHQAQSYKGDLYTDLFDFCDKLMALLPHSHRISKKCKDIKNAIEGSIVLKSCYAGAEFQHSHGVSLYFPWNARDYWHEYENLEFAQKTGWDDFLKSYLRATRRERRDAHKELATETITLRHGPLPYDPLVKAGTEDRIRVGTEDRIRAGTEDRIRAGTEDRVRAGTEDRIRAGTEDRIRGKLRFSSMKNPPDGFYRCECDCKKPRHSE